MKLAGLELLSGQTRDDVIKYLKQAPLRKLAQITCKNEGCKERRRNGSKFCQKCSDKYNKQNG